MNRGAGYWLNSPLNHLHPTTTEILFLSTLEEEERIFHHLCPNHGTAKTLFVTSSQDHLVVKTSFFTSFHSPHSRSLLVSILLLYSSSHGFNSWRNPWCESKSTPPKLLIMKMATAGFSKTPENFNILHGMFSKAKVTN
jgi:hypothetical protein